ncbi:MAG: cache domain-containing protein, partial [Desulfobacteraceae bacterium]
MIKDIIEKLQGVSLKWKLLIPFLFFAFAGTTSLTYIGLTSQHRLIKKEERKQLLMHYRNFVNEIEKRKREAVALASMVAENKEVQRLLAERDRAGLDRLLVNTYVRLHKDQGISQFHFHLPSEISFLRLHHPLLYGDPVSQYRETIKEAMERCEPTAGLEWGETGLGIRGVVPVFYNARLVGTVEIGHSCGEPFLEALHSSWGIDIALYRRASGGRYLPMAEVSENTPKEVFLGPVERAPGAEQDPLVLISPQSLQERSILIKEVEDYGGEPVAQVEISLDRSSIRQRLSRTRDLMILVGCVGIVVSFLLTYMVTAIFIRPIRKIVGVAQEIADEKREIQLEPGPRDEIGTLTHALNLMLTALKERRIQIEGYARHLERRVEERTQDLVASEEKYRTLVENVPLIVYRVLPDGTTEFINSHLTESLGYAIEEAVGDRNFWREKILGSDPDAWKELFETCFEQRDECRIERVVMDREGRPLVFLDHAMPAVDEHGKVKWIDGIMMEITELKRLQERAVRSEEIRLLGEISARMAHEI